MKYTIRHVKPHLKYIHVEALLENITADITEIQLPSWRPGRYELGNFAKNVRNFEIKDGNGNSVPFMKINKDLWQVQTNGCKSITISYKYYASVLDAGSTYTDDQLLYVNPVNCLVYDTTRLDEPCALTLDVPDDFTIACALPLTGKTLYADNFDALADSPLIASPTIEHHAFEMEGVQHHIWLNGTHTLDTGKFIEDVKKYTAEQAVIFNHYPEKDFHYLIHMLPNHFRHGVEHGFSTVIAMGPGNEFHNQDKHNDLLAICSHELFHFWNVKRLRPASMVPYDFTRENYSALGYVYEGVTTYYGDYMLLRSGVLDFEAYANEVSKDFQRHFDNSGRYNYSVAESSMDTWLDGYTPGTPGRKVSIYVEGMLAALIADVEIRKATGNKSSLDTVMRVLYDRCYRTGHGYTEEDYRAALEEVSGKDFEWFFKDIIWGRGHIEKYLPATLNQLGLEITTSPADRLHERYFGFKTSVHGEHLSIAAVTEDSPADGAGLPQSATILSANGESVKTPDELDEVIEASNQLVLELSVKSIHYTKVCRLQTDGNEYFPHYRIVKVSGPTTEQAAFYRAWSGQEF